MRKLWEGLEEIHSLAMTISIPELTDQTLGKHIYLCRKQSTSFTRSKYEEWYADSIPYTGHEKRDEAILV